MTSAGTDLAMIISLVVLFAFVVLLGAAEAALLRVPRVSVAVRADGGSRRAARLLGLLDDLPRVMNTVLLAVLLSQIGAATITGVLASRHFGGVGVTLASIGLTVVLFVYGEAIPKTYAVRHPLRVATALHPLVASLARALRPVVTALVTLADFQAPGTGVAAHLGVTEEELRRLAAEAATAGEIDDSDAELMDRAFALGDLQVREILVPRIDVVSVPAAASAHEALDVAVAAGHRRLPVRGASVDELVGVVRMRDLARAVADESTVTAADLAGPVITVPEMKRVVELLREMQAASVHLAVVVDEHGGTEGIVTIEDVVEELVGEVADEGEPTTALVVTLGGGRWWVDAAAPLADVETALGIELPRGDWTTVGGLIVATVGSIPPPGTEVVVGGHRFTVTRAGSRRVREVVLEIAD